MNDCPYCAPDEKCALHTKGTSMRATTLTQTVVLNGRRFPRYLTSPHVRGWRIADMAATGDDRYLPETYPNKRMALAAAKKLNRS